MARELSVSTYDSSRDEGKITTTTIARPTDRFHRCLTISAQLIRFSKGHGLLAWTHRPFLSSLPTLGCLYKVRLSDFPLVMVYLDTENLFISLHPLSDILTIAKSVVLFPGK